MNSLSKLRSLKNYKHFNKASAGIGVVLFAVVGTILLLNTRAATPFASIEPENGTLSRTDLSINDTAASGSKAVKFSMAPIPSTGICTGRDANGGVPADKFPGAACTGVPPGVVLKRVPLDISSGPGWRWVNDNSEDRIVVDGANAVLDGLDIPGCVYVWANNVTIKNSRIRASCYYIIKLFIDESNKFSGTKVIDVEIDGTNILSPSVGINKDNFMVLRANIHRITGKAVQLGSNSSVEDSYVHDYACNTGAPASEILHQSGIGTNGGTVNSIMRHNNIDMPPTDCTSGGISNYDDFGAFQDVIIDRNIINSGGFCLKAGFEAGSASGSGMKVTNNTFGRKYYPECGFYGTTSNWFSGAGNVWSGNVWGDGAAATSSHRTGDAVAEP